MGADAMTAELGLAFDRFQLDADSGDLRTVGPVPLTPKALAVLQYLAAGPESS